MNNTSYLYNNISENGYGVKIEYSCATIKLKSESINANTINKILGNIIYIRNRCNCELVIFQIYNLIFSDDATANMFEIILYDLLKNGVKKIKLNSKAINKNAYNYNFYVNSLLFNKTSIDYKFLAEFEKKKNITFSNYRAILKSGESRDNLSKIYSDIPVFLKPQLTPQIIDEELSENIAEIVSEIAGNALDHSDSDCLINLKVFDAFYKKKRRFKVINIVVLNISPTMIYTKLKDAIESNNLSGNNKMVLEAYNYHKNYFDEKYDLNLFAFLSTFQKSVTTRKNSKGSGGTGLTMLIKYLIGRTYENNCYVKSGVYSYLFREENLRINEDGTIGFNENNNYYMGIPSKSYYSNNEVNFNGTMYNLTLVLKGEDN